MNSEDVIRLFGSSGAGTGVERILEVLGTYQRPQPLEDHHHFYDWILVRRQGVELGFVDSEYQSGAPSFRWGRGELLLAQAYFYAGFDNVSPFTGELPLSLDFADTREIARAKLAAFESTRHSYRTDAWDVENYRLSVTYAPNGSAIDRIACRMLPAAIRAPEAISYPEIDTIAETFGSTIRSPEFLRLWSTVLSSADYRDAREDGEIDLMESHGATIGCAASGTDPVFQSITLHRNRDMKSVGWSGSLPQGLDFDDSPEVLFMKISAQPVQHKDSTLTGHAVWHFDDYTLHVLYSNLDNRLLRVKMIAPGTWKCVEDSAFY